MEALLPLIFLIHVIAFSALAIRRKQGYYWVFALGFLLLIFRSLFQQYWPAIHLAGFPVYNILRFSAWAVLGTVSVLFFIMMKQEK